MLLSRAMESLKSLHDRLNGCTIEYDLSEYSEILSAVRNNEQELKSKTDSQLKIISREFALRIKKGESTDQLIIESYALVCEAIRRVLKLDPFDVQIIGGIAMSRGKIVEIATGEGKTLTAVFPVYLNALAGSGVHVLTFNDYLARRDTEWMGPVYNYLGLETRYIQQNMNINERKKAYNADITYLTAKESGFDYLRDNLYYNEDNRVQRKFNYAVVDEADSILIDEARNPLIIAGNSSEEIENVLNEAEIVKSLRYDEDYIFDEYSRNVNLTDKGARHIESQLKCGSLYNQENVDLLIRLNCSLHAENLLTKDVDYIVKDGKIEIVDEFTGRAATGRRWPDGLQAALESKESLNRQNQGSILNSITMYHFLQNYPKICGMTATAQTSHEELKTFYNLDVVVIPSNRPCIRADRKDLLFRTRTEKQKSLIKEIIEVHNTGRPILIGTSSVNESVVLAAALKKQRIKCEVLNAQNDEYEAQIIAQAGMFGAVTISTSMAGRGTDIKLGGSDETEKQKVLDLGGLYVIGTNRYESRRIDNQLRGRAGRQGDPGESRFFISLEDDIFTKYRLNELFSAKILKDHDDSKIYSNIIHNEIDRVQRIIEGQNLDIKMTLLKYSSTIEKQRMIIINKRNDVFKDEIILDYFRVKFPEQYAKYEKLADRKNLIVICKKIYLTVLDRYWSNYLSEIAEIREGIHLISLSGKDPFINFQKLSIELFSKYLKKLDDEVLRVFNNLKFTGDTVDDNEFKTPSSTWTYLISDKPFENQVGMKLMGDIGLSVGAPIMAPLLALHHIIKIRKK